MKYKDKDKEEIHDKEVKMSKTSRVMHSIGTIITVITVVLIIYLFISLIIKINEINSTLDKYDERVSKLSAIVDNDINDELEDAINTLEEISNYYEGLYVNDIDYDNLKLNLVNALIQSYGDKYGEYLTPELAVDSKRQMNNLVYGIGVLVRAELGTDTETDETSKTSKDDIYIIDVYEGSGAEEVGITAGCRLTKINGEDINFDEKSYNDIIDSIRGEENTTVNITYIDTDNKEHTVDVVRKAVTTNTVKYQVLDDNVGYIKIREFNSNTDEEFKEALEYMTENNISNFVFDLRDNPGGLLDSVVNTLDILLPNQTMLYVVDSNGDTVDTYKSDKDCMKFNSVCLVNENTASAAELFTQTLKDEKLTTVIGTKTYGKGTVCTVLTTSDGGSLQISTNKYLTPSKTCVEGVGVIPDIEMKLSEDKAKISYKLDIKEDDLINKAIDTLNK